MSICERDFTFGKQQRVHHLTRAITSGVQTITLCADTSRTEKTEQQTKKKSLFKHVRCFSAHKKQQFRGLWWAVEGLVCPTGSGVELQTGLILPGHCYRVKMATQGHYDCFVLRLSCHDLACLMSMSSALWSCLKHGLCFVIYSSAHVVSLFYE